MIKVLGNQTFYDISIQYFGTADYAFLIAVANKKSISSTLASGDELVLPNVPIIPEVIQFYKSRNIVPATGIKLQEDQELIKETGFVPTLERKNQNGLVKVKALNRQTFYDVSIQYYGTADYAFSIAYANQKSISSTLKSGDELVLPQNVKDEKAIQYYVARNIVPATGLTLQTPIVVSLDYELPGEFPLSF